MQAVKWPEHGRDLTNNYWNILLTDKHYGPSLILQGSVVAYK